MQNWKMPPDTFLQATESSFWVFLKYMYKYWTINEYRRNIEMALLWRDTLCTHCLILWWAAAIPQQDSFWLPHPLRPQQFQCHTHCRTSLSSVGVRGGWGAGGCPVGLAGGWSEEECESCVGGGDTACSAQYKGARKWTGDEATGGYTVRPDMEDAPKVVALRQASTNCKSLLLVGAKPNSEIAPFVTILGTIGAPAWNTTSATFPENPLGPPAYCPK